MAPTKAVERNWIPFDPMLTTHQAAELLSVDYMSIMKWIHDGKLKAHRVGGKAWRIHAQDLQDFIDGGQRRTPAS